MIQADVVIVGAGFAGLAAARVLSDAGRTVAVIEARNRVGGRAHTAHLSDGTPLDLGAQFVGPGQSRILALAKKLGVKIVPNIDDGRHVSFLDGKHQIRRGSFPPAGLRERLAAYWVLNRLDRLTKNIPKIEPWRANNAAVLDRQTLASWLDDQLGTRSGRWLVELSFELLTASNSAEMSLLHAHGVRRQMHGSVLRAFLAKRRTLWPRNERRRAGA